MQKIWRIDSFKLYLRGGGNGSRFGIKQKLVKFELFLFFILCEIILEQTALLIGYLVLKSSSESNEIGLLNLSCGCGVYMDVLFHAQYVCVYKIFRCYFFVHELHTACAL